MKKKKNKEYPEWWEVACNALGKKDIIMQNLINKYTDSCLSTIKNPFYSLSRCIVGQQISVQAADAVWNRLIEGFNIYDANCFKKIKPNFLKSFGLSERKANYLIGLSDYMSENNVYKYWNRLEDEEIFSKLIKLKGIGPWSIKMFLIFSLNRRDIFSSEDLGLLKAIGINYYNGKVPNKELAEKLSMTWSPWRTAASWFLWRSIDPNVVTY